MRIDYDTALVSGVARLNQDGRLRRTKALNAAWDLNWIRQAWYLGRGTADHPGLPSAIVTRDRGLARPVEMVGHQHTYGDANLPSVKVRALGAG